MILEPDALAIISLSLSFHIFSIKSRLFLQCLKQLHVFSLGLNSFSISVVCSEACVHFQATWWGLREGSSSLNSAFNTTSLPSSYRAFVAQKIFPLMNYLYLHLHNLFYLLLRFLNSLSPKDKYAAKVSLLDFCFRVELVLSLTSTRPSESLTFGLWLAASKHNS